MIEAFCASISPSDLPVIHGHQVTQAELDAVTTTATPYFVGLGPIDNPESLNDRQIQREAKRRARLMSADVHKELSKQAAAQTVNGQPVAGCFLTVMFLTVILPSLITWVIEQLILWIIKKNWPASTAGVQPATCSMLNNLTPCQEMDVVNES